MLRELGTTGVTTGPNFSERGRCVVATQHVKQFAAQFGFGVVTDAHAGVGTHILQGRARRWRGLACILRDGGCDDGRAGK